MSNGENGLEYVLLSDVLTEDELAEARRRSRRPDHIEDILSRPTLGFAQAEVFVERAEEAVRRGESAPMRIIYFPSGSDQPRITVPGED